MSETIALELLASNDYYNIELHNKHKDAHEISEKFGHAEIDEVADGRLRAKLKAKKMASQQEVSERKKKPEKIKRKRSEL